MTGILSSNKRVFHMYHFKHLPKIVTLKQTLQRLRTQWCSGKNRDSHNRDSMSPSSQSNVTLSKSRPRSRSESELELESESEFVWESDPDSAYTGAQPSSVAQHAKESSKRVSVSTGLGTRLPTSRLFRAKASGAPSSMEYECVFEYGSTRVDPVFLATLLVLSTQFMYYPDNIKLQFVTELRQCMAVDLDEQNLYVALNYKKTFSKSGASRSFTALQWQQHA